MRGASFKWYHVNISFSYRLVVPQDCLLQCCHISVYVKDISVNIKKIFQGRWELLDFVLILVKRF
jgi:hypothetical protein